MSGVRAWRSSHVQQLLRACLCLRSFRELGGKFRIGVAKVAQYYLREGANRTVVPESVRWRLVDGRLDSLCTDARRQRI